MEELEFKKFLNLVWEMRRTQKEYFITRSAEALNKSRGLERKVDIEVRRITGGVYPREIAIQTELFDKGSGL